MTIAKITYFDIRARAEPIRLVFEELSIAYKDVRVSPEEWHMLAPNTPFGRLPSLEIDGIVIYQTHAILRYLARKHDLYGQSAADQLRCDIAADVFADLNNSIGMAPWRDDFDQSRVRYIQTELAPMLMNLERFHLNREAGSDYWVGDALTFIDFLAFAHLDCAFAMFPEAFFSLDSLTEFMATMLRRPRIKSYYESQRRPGAAQVGPGGLIIDSHHWEVPQQPE